MKFRVTKIFLCFLAMAAASVSGQAKVKVKNISAFTDSVTTTMVIEYSKAVSNATIRPKAYSIPEMNILKAYATSDEGVADPTVANFMSAEAGDGKFVVLIAVDKNGPQTIPLPPMPMNGERPEETEGAPAGFPGGGPGGFPGGFPGGGPGGFPGMPGMFMMGNYFDITGREEVVPEVRQIGAIRDVKGNIVEPWEYGVPSDVTYSTERRELPEGMRGGFPGGPGGFPGGGPGGFPGGGPGGFPGGGPGRF